MFVTITVKAESEPEDLEFFGSYVQNMQNHFESLKKEGAFGPGEKITLRYLVVCAPGQEPEKITVAHVTEEPSV